MTRRTTKLSLEQARELEPFAEAAKRGLRRSNWRPGDPVEYLIAPITLAVLVEVSKRCRLGDLLREMDSQTTT